MKPIRERRSNLEINPDDIFILLHHGMEEARSLAQETFMEAQEMMGLVIGTELRKAPFSLIGTRLMGTYCNQGE